MYHGGQEGGVICIILYKKPGLPLDYDLLEASFKANPDGAGLMFPSSRSPGKLRVVKGFMTFDPLKTFLESSEKWLVSNAVNFHFRIGTHGQTSRANCHPFPISNDHRYLTNLDVTVSYAVMHNGIIPAYLAPADPFFSDTAMYVRDRVAKRRGKKKMVAELRACTGFNKFALMDGRSGMTTLVGEFARPDSAKEYIVSNTSYVRKQTYVSAYKGGTTTGQVNKTPFVAPASTYRAPTSVVRTVLPVLPTIPPTKDTGVGGRGKSGGDIGATISPRPHYGLGWDDGYGDEAWWLAQEEQEKEFLQKWEWRESDSSLVVPDDKPYCEFCGEDAPCYVYGTALCVDCMVGLVQDVPEDEIELVKGELTCPEKVGE